MMLKLHCDNCDLAVNEEDVTLGWVIISTLGRDVQAHNIECAHALLDKVQAEHNNYEQVKAEMMNKYVNYSTHPLLTRDVEPGGPYKTDLWAQDQHP